MIIRPLKILQIFQIRFQLFNQFLYLRNSFDDLVINIHHITSIIPPESTGIIISTTTTR